MPFVDVSTADVPGRSYNIEPTASGRNDTSNHWRRRLSGTPLSPVQRQYREALQRIRLREAFTVITKEKTQILEENRRLKELLEAHGIPYDNGSLLGRTSAHLQRQEGIDQAPEVARFNRTYDEIGVDFVLA
jgi:hypothetical protein